MEKGVLQDLKRSQATRGRKAPHRTQFFVLPRELCEHSDNDAVVSAALTAGLYPRLMKAEGKMMRTMANNQAVQFHPTSVNSFRRLNDVACNYYTYFTLTWVLESFILTRYLARNFADNRKINESMPQKVDLPMICPCFCYAETRSSR